MPNILAGDHEDYPSIIKRIALFLDVKTIIKTCIYVCPAWCQVLNDNNATWFLLTERELKLTFLHKPEQHNRPTSSSSSQSTSLHLTEHLSPTASQQEVLEIDNWKRLYFLLTRFSRWRWRRGFERNIDVENNRKQPNDNTDQQVTLPFNNPVYFSPLIHNHHFKAMIIGDKKGMLLMCEFTVLMSFSW